MGVSSLPLPWAGTPMTDQLLCPTEVQQTGFYIDNTIQARQES